MTHDTITMRRGWDHCSMTVVHAENEKRTRDREIRFFCSWVERMLRDTYIEFSHWSEDTSASATKQQEERIFETTKSEHKTSRISMPVFCSSVRLQTDSC